MLFVVSNKKVKIMYRGNVCLVNRKGSSYSGCGSTHFIANSSMGRKGGGQRKILPSNKKLRVNVGGRGVNERVVCSTDFDSLA